MSLSAVADRVTQGLLAPGADAYFAAALAKRMAAAGDGAVLDVGCGYVSRVDRPALVGLDIDPSRVRRIRGLGVAADAAALPFADASFDGVVSVGLLHHLPDPAARQTIAEMVRVARPTGLVLVFDAVRPRRWGERPLAALIRAADRGRHMRREVELRGLFGLGWRFERVDYARTGLEGLWCAHRRELA